MSEPGFMGFQDYHDLFHHGNPLIKRIMVQDNQFRINHFTYFRFSLYFSVVLCASVVNLFYGV